MKQCSKVRQALNSFVKYLFFSNTIMSEWLFSFGLFLLFYQQDIWRVFTVYVNVRNSCIASQFTASRRREEVPNLTNYSLLIFNWKNKGYFRVINNYLILYGIYPVVSFTKKTHWIFDVLLTVHLSIFISVINQLDAQNVCFTVSLFHASTCFEYMCSSSGGQKCITQPLVSSHWNKWVV